MSSLQAEGPIRVMTYAEIEAETGLKPASARQLVRRNGWRRIPGNDGRTRIEVPVIELERCLNRGPDLTPSSNEEESNLPFESPFAPPLITALNAHIERLERAIADSESALSTMTEERDKMRSVAESVREEAWAARAQIDVLRTQLEAEREKTLAASQRANDAISDRDRWHSIAETHSRSWWKRIAG